MNVMPPPGPQRRRLFVLLGLLAVAGVVLYYQWNAGAPAAAPAPVAKVNPVEALLNQSTPAKLPVKPGVGPNAQVPEALKLAQLDERVPEEPAAGRNLFRFGVPPPPPAPPPPVYVPPPPVVQGPPPPPPIPPILLKYTTFVQDPYGRPRAYLTDTTGKVFEAVEGDVVDGKYKLHKVTPKFVEISWFDGSGRKTIPLGG